MSKTAHELGSCGIQRDPDATGGSVKVLRGARRTRKRHRSKCRSETKKAASRLPFLEGRWFERIDHGETKDPHTLRTLSSPRRVL